MRIACCQKRFISIMNIVRSIPSIALSACVVLAGAFLYTPARGAETEVRRAETAKITGEEVLRLVRMSQALQDLKLLQGALRDDKTGKKIPFTLTMADGVIRFVFKDPNEIINLDINDKSSPTLRRITSGNDIVVPRSLGSQTVRDTFINYEDLSMRFLYWPNAKILDEERVRTRKCWKVRVITPDNRGPYATVDIWVDQDSGAMMQMEAYDAKGVKIKNFKVISGQKHKGAWILKEMRVESFDPLKPGDLKGRTYMDIKDPE